MDTGDQQRMDFMLARDGRDAALEFAKQCVNVYRGAVLASKRKNGRRGHYRQAYIESYLYHKQYVKVYDNAM